MKIGIYPRYSLKGGSKEYLESVVALAKDFEIEVTEIVDQNHYCTSAAIDLNNELSFSSSAIILAQAEKDCFDEILVLCVECYKRLKDAQQELSKNNELKNKIASIIKIPYTGSIKLINIFQFIDKYIIDNIQYKQDRTLDYKAASCYCCLLNSSEVQKSMANILNLIGATPIELAIESQCDDTYLSKSETEIIAKSAQILDDAVSKGAEVIVVACPVCHSNLDKHRPKINKYLNKNIQIPVIYITQAIGIAAGIDNTRLGLQRHHVPIDLPYQSDIEHVAKTPKP